MKPNAAKQVAKVTPDSGYRLEQQVGYILRQASQRHAAIFAARIPEQLTTTQFATPGALAGGRTLLAGISSAA